MALFSTNEKVTGHGFGFCSLRRLTSDLNALWESIQSDLPKYIEQASNGTPSFAECLQESIVVRWLTFKERGNGLDRDLSPIFAFF